MIKNLIHLSISMLLLSSCSTPKTKGTFGYDLNFLKQHQKIVTLQTNGGKSQLIVLPQLQGRVITSTSSGFSGNSYGWMHYDLIASGDFEEHYNPFGGEDRFWIGPEGGQYSVFFKKGSDFTFNNWYTPAEIDTESFEIIKQNKTQVSLQKRFSLENYQDFKFDIEVKREISIFSKKEIESNLGIKLNAVDYVGFQSYNQIVNKGEQTWKKETGLLSIWILGMFMPSENTTVILPYKNELALNTSYFGTIPPERVNITDKHVMFKGNGTSRFKLGLPPQNTLPYVGSYDANKNILTIVSYTFQDDTSYVNSVWRKTNKPYGGDVVNAYNDGPLENGDQLGPFYELESSSSAKELQPGRSITHTHKTYHFEGDFEPLNSISKQLLHKDLNEL